MYCCRRNKLTNAMPNFGKTKVSIKAEVQSANLKLLRATLFGGQKKLDYSCDQKRYPKEIENLHKIKVTNDTNSLPLYTTVHRFKSKYWHQWIGFQETFKLIMEFGLRFSFKIYINQFIENEIVGKHTFCEKFIFIPPAICF